MMLSCNNMRMRRRQGCLPYALRFTSASESPTQGHEPIVVQLQHEDATEAGLLAKYAKPRERSQLPGANHHLACSCHGFPLKGGCSSVYVKTAVWSTAKAAADDSQHQHTNDCRPRLVAEAALEQIGRTHFSGEDSKDTNAAY